MNDKKRVAKYAAKMVMNGMTVGLGTGSTADYFIEELARRINEDALQVTTVASSVVSMIKAQSLKLPLIAIEHINQLDLYVDGADEVTPDNTLLKGQGADLVKEKLLARSAKKFIVLADQTKRVAQLGEKFPIPIEVIPFAWQLVKQQLDKLGGVGKLRQKGNGLAISSHGSLILDIEFPSSLKNCQLDSILNGIPGIVEHGIFHNLANVILVAENDKVKEISTTNVLKNAP